MNLCDNCSFRDHGCHESGADVPLCVEYRPRNPADCRAAQLWHASHIGAPHWQALLRMIDLETQNAPGGADR